MALSPITDLNAAQDADERVNEELQFHVWPYDICMSTTLRPYEPRDYPATEKMFNFVTVEIWKYYTFGRTNDTVSEDPLTVLHDGTGYNMCGNREYYTESASGGQVTHTVIFDEDE